MNPPSQPQTKLPPSQQYNPPPKKNISHPSQAQAFPTFIPPPSPPTHTPIPQAGLGVHAMIPFFHYKITLGYASRGIFRMLSKIKLFVKIISNFQPLTILEKTPPQMFNRDLNQPLGHYVWEVVFGKFNTFFWQENEFNIYVGVLFPYISVLNHLHKISYVATC